MYCAHDITETAGHTFIIDEYDSNGKFHINWGYRGDYQSSYFSITDLLLYPNPTGGPLTVQSPKPLARVEVYGLGGERLLESHDTTLDLHALSDGMYIVMLHFADGTRHSEKVVKQL